MYKAIQDFKDLMTGHNYKKGDTYPYEGRADPKRVEILIKPTIQRGALIELVLEEPKPATKAPTKKSK